MNQSEQEHAELLMLYEQATQDIRTFQERQTTVTNLTVLVYAALIALAPTIPPTSRRDLPLMTITVGAAFSSLAWLLVLHAAIQRARGKVDRAKAHFSEAFKKASGKSPTTGRRKIDWDVLPVLIGVVLMGLLITLTILRG